MHCYDPAKIVASIFQIRIQIKKSDSLERLIYSRKVQQFTVLKSVYAFASHKILVWIAYHSFNPT